MQLTTPPIPLGLPKKFFRGSIAAILATLLTISAIASVWQFLLKHFAHLGLIGWVSLTVYAVGFAALVFFCAQPHSDASERKLVGWTLALTFLLKLLCVMVWSHFPQSGDRVYLMQFVDRWASGGDAALQQLSREVHDYPVWSGRAWPFLYPLRVLFPTHFVFATQVFNCVLSTALLAAIYGLTRGLVTRPLIPLALAAISPVFYWSVLEYGYRCQGLLLLLTALAFLRFFLRGNTSTQLRLELLMSILLGLTLFLLHLQRGLDFVVISLLIITLAYAAWQQKNSRSIFRLVLLTLILPVAMMVPFSKVADAWLAKRDIGKLNSGFIMHMAIGWNLVTWGEFYLPVEVLDSQTPPALKKKVMLGYIQQQIQEHPFDALVRLPLVKAIKLFQLGSSGDIEGKFSEAGQAHWAAVFKAARLVFAPVVLLLAAIGCWRFLRSAAPERVMWSLLVLDFTTAYTFFSETSPHYSIYFQFVLLACAAEGVMVVLNLSSRSRQHKNAPQLSTSA